MAERWHVENDKWTGYFGEKSFYNNDIAGFDIDKMRDSYSAVIKLVNGRQICPDYTSYGTRKEALEVLLKWIYVYAGI